MIPVIGELLSRAALPLAIDHHALPPRRVWVRDPAGRAPLARQAVLEGVTCMGGIVECCHVRLGAHEMMRVPPDWLQEITSDERANVIPFPVRPR